jgi:hypothetical protein
MDLAVAHKNGQQLSGEQRPRQHRAAPLRHDE